MAKETEDDFLAGLNPTEQPLGVDSGELFPEERVEEKEEEEEVPFHKNEKAQRYINKMVEKRLKDFKPSAEQTFKEEVLQGEPKFFSSLEKVIGNDTPEKIQALKDIKDDWASMSKQAKQEAVSNVLEAQREAEQNEQTEISEAVDELDEGREEIEEHYGKALTERQWDGYKEYLLDIEPRGGYQEYPDFLKTFDYFKRSNSRSNATAKSLASRGMERSSVSSEVPKTGGSWKDFEAVKDQLLAK
jgi:hypothetical protein